jgi:TetR/AcrR family transcriptional regulator, lmrAB and yxaGH operons repressor
MTTEKPTRERFLNAAAELFQRQGYAATGLSEITELGGAPKGSLYFHFPGGKEQLGVEALTLAGERFAVLIRGILEKAPSSEAGVQTIIEAMSNGLEATDYQLGCPVATTALETATKSSAIREAANDAFASWTEALRDRFAADGVDGKAAERRAVLVLSAIEGALVLSRAANSTRPLELVAEQLLLSAG